MLCSRGDFMSLSGWRENYINFVQPEVLAFHSDVLPRLLVAMTDDNKDTQERCCYAIEHFLENLGLCRH